MTGVGVGLLVGPLPERPYDGEVTLPALASRLLAAVTVLTATTRALGADPAADALFAAGKQLMSEGKVEEACPKFEESYRLDPALGALLNLANCLERSGRVASAWTRWGEAADLASRLSDDRRAFAEQRREALRPRLPTLEIRTEGGAEGISLWRDGIEVGAGALAVPLPVDPGPHRVEVARGDDLLHAELVTAVESKASTVMLNLSALAGKTPIGRRAGAPPR